MARRATQRRKPPKESRFDLWFRRSLRVSGLVGFFVLLFVYAVLGREVNPAWLFLIGGMLTVDGAAGLLLRK